MEKPVKIASQDSLIKILHRSTVYTDRSRSRTCCDVASEGLRPHTEDWNDNKSAQSLGWPELALRKQAPAKFSGLGTRKSKWHIKHERSSASKSTIASRDGNEAFWLRQAARSEHCSLHGSQSGPGSSPAPAQQLVAMSMSYNVYGLRISKLINVIYFAYNIYLLYSYQP